MQVMETKQNQQSAQTTEKKILPPGHYMVKPTYFGKQENKAKTGHYIKSCFEVTDGDYAGEKIYEYMNYDNPNEFARKFAVKAANSLVKAMTKKSDAQISDEDWDEAFFGEFLGKPVLAKVKVEEPKPGSKYGPSNKIEDFISF